MTPKMVHMETRSHVPTQSVPVGGKCIEPAGSPAMLWIRKGCLTHSSFQLMEKFRWLSRGQVFGVDVSVQWTPSITLEPFMSRANSTQQHSIAKQHYAALPACHQAFQAALKICSSSLFTSCPCKASATVGWSQMGCSGWSQNDYGWQLYG